MNFQHAGDEYLETAVFSASPAKLRLMTIELALQKTNEAIAAARQEGKVQPNEHTITLRDALDELLSGVAPSKDALPHQVADLYVFLLQWLTTAERQSDFQKLEDIRRVLEIERETWTEIVNQTMTSPMPPAPLSGTTDESFSFDA